MLVRTIRYTPSKIGRVPTQVDYSDYRDAGGVKFPYRWIFTWLDGRDEFDYADVKFNMPIDAAKFGEPVLTGDRSSGNSVGAGLKTRPYNSDLLRNGVLVALAVLIETAVPLEDFGVLVEDAIERHADLPGPRDTFGSSMVASCWM